MLLILPLSSIQGHTGDRDIVVFKLDLNHKYWGRVSVLCDSTRYYINLPELLTQLEYKHNVDYQHKIFTGYLNEADSSSFTFSGNSLNHSLWSDDGEFFLESSEIEKRYECKFIFTLGSLAVNMVTDKGVPIVLRRLREEKVAHMTKQKAERELINADTFPPKIFSVNSIGYALNANVGMFNNVSFNGNVAGEAFRGTYILNYEIGDDNLPWSSNVRVDWKKPFLNKKWLKTLRVFHEMNNMAISSDGYMTGVMISNDDYTSNFTRGHLFQGRTTPDTNIEIYNNGQLIQYLKSDSLGNYQVEINSYEGENNIKAISYDSFGVPMVNESMVYMPHGLQAKKRFIYTASAGFNDYGEAFSNLMCEYGLLDNLTLGLTSQTLFKYGNIKSIAMLSTKYTILNRARVYLNYIPNIKFSSILTGNFGTRFTVNLTYESYKKNQNIINTNITKNFIARINGSISIKNLNGNYYASVQYYKFGETASYNSFLSMNLWWRKLSATLSFSTVSQKMKLHNPVYEIRTGYRFNNNMYNELSVCYRNWSKSLSVRNRFNYKFSNDLNAYCELSYNSVSKNYSISLGGSWRLPWAQFRGGAQQSRNSTTAFANVSGSILLCERMNVAFTDKFASGASLLIVPFLDVNGNGVKDNDEIVMKETQLLNRTRMDMQRTKKGVFFSNITPNQGFKIIVPRQTYEDITWQIEPQDICMVLAPHQSQTIQIPVKVLTELAGKITVNTNGQAGVLDGLPITIKNLQTNETMHIVSDDWGYYSVMVVCGEYSIALNTVSLERVRVECKNPVRHITIAPSREGQQLIDLDFTCMAK